MICCCRACLVQAVFPEGTPGVAIDALARLPLWSDGLNYRHGTGAEQQVPRPPRPPFLILWQLPAAELLFCCMASYGNVQAATQAA
jgi:hypothetical protein